MSWRLVESDAELAQVLSGARRCEALVLDTEFMRRNTFYPRVALLQLCLVDGPGDAERDEPVAWLIDPLQIEDAGPIIDLLEDTSVIKVLHSASEDLEVFQHWLGVLPQPLFDTQRAAALLNIGFGMGYSSLVEALTGVVLPKGETRSDWLQRPLTESQCEYAAQDVTCLTPVWRELRDRTRSAGRFDWVLEDGATAVAGAMRPAEDYHRKLKGAWQLAPRQLAVLAGLCEWRERTARERDKPRGWIIDDKACLALAQSCPVTVHDMAAAVDLPAPVLRRYSDTLLDIVQANSDLPETDCPPPLPRPLSAQQRDQLKKLKARGRELGLALDTAPEVLLQSKDYELLLRAAAGEAIAEPEYLNGWRRDTVVAPLRASLDPAA
ncbi:MAG: ribonuclease D [Halioglobus sp.]